MNETGHPFGLTDDDFWDDPWKTRGALMFEAVSNTRPTLMLDGPVKVPLSIRNRLPLALIYAAEQRELESFRLEDLTVLVATNLDTGTAMFGRAFEAPARPMTPTAPSSSSKNFTGRSLLIDPSAQLGLPWRAARYEFGLLVRDRRSNRVPIELSGGSDYVDPAVIEFKRRYRRRPPNEVRPPAHDPHCRYWPLPSSPEVPETVGFSIDIERVALLSSPRAGRLEVSFRLPYNDWDRRPEPAAEAVTVPINLAITHTRDHGCTVLRMRVPSWDTVDREAESGIVTGHFALDLFACTHLPRAPQTCFLHCWSRDLWAEVTPFALVTEAELEY